MSHTRAALAALLLGCLTVAGISIHNWKRHTDQRTYYAEQAGAYLFAPSGIVDAKGRDLTRQELIDLYLHALIEKNPQAGFHAK